MKKFFATIALALVTVLGCNAQDFIVLKTGDEIKSKVLEISQTEIKYKKFDNLEGPTISIEKQTVFMIRYANGTKDVINQIISGDKPSTTNSTTNSSSTTNTATTSSSANNNSTTDNYSSDLRTKACLYIAPSIPLGDFASETNGAAKLGGTFGVEWFIPFNTPYFGLASNINLSYNSAKIETSSNYYSNGYYYNAKSASSWGYLSEWTMLGLRAQGIAGKTKFYALGLLGANYTLITGDLSDYGSGIGFAYGVGTGIVFDRFSLGIRYFGSSLKFTNDNTTPSQSFTQKISTLQITVGLVLGK